MTDLINRPQYLNQLIQNKDVDLVKDRYRHPALWEVLFTGSVSQISDRKWCSRCSHYTHEYGIPALP